MKKHLIALIVLLAMASSLLATTAGTLTNPFAARPDFRLSAQKPKQDGNSQGDTITISVDKSFADIPTLPDPTTLFDFGSKETPLTDDNATRLINATLTAVTTGYCIMHVVQWDNVKAQVLHELWFLYKATGTAGSVKWKKQKDFDGKRIYGSRDVAVLLVHLNPATTNDRRSLAWDISYKVAVNKKTPAPFQHLMQLIGALSAQAALAPPPPAFWGGQSLDIKNLPSDIVVSASIAIAGQQNKEFTNTYDDEGFYHWDVSLGVPINSIKELEFVSEGNRVTTAPKERQNVYGFLNIYPVAVDVKADSVLTIPHFVFGVPLASKPLHHPFAGAGIGIYKAPIKFNLFAGVIFNRERVPSTLKEGQVATPSQLDADLKTRWVRKFAFGINFPIGQIKDAIKK